MALLNDKEINQIILESTGGISPFFLRLLLMAFLKKMFDDFFNELELLVNGNDN